MPTISRLRTATRVALLSTTALVALPSASFAVDYVIDDATEDTVILGLGTADSLLLTTDEDPGSISSVSPGVAVIDIADSITVHMDSYIDGLEIGIEVEGENTDLTGGIHNEGIIAGGTGELDPELDAGFGLRVSTGADISGGVENSGLVTGDIAGIGISGTFVTGNTTAEGTTGGYYSGGAISGGIENSGLIAGEDFGGIVAYNGGSISGGIVNGEDGEIGGALAGIVVFAGGDIAGSTGGEVAGIDNDGIIAGYGVGIASIGASPDLVIGETGFTFHTSHFAQPNRFGADISGGINNTGTIFGEFAAIATAIDGDISGGIVNGEDGYIGVDTEDGFDQSEVGIISLGNSDISGEIRNAGVIFGEYASIGSAAGGDISGGIVNEADGLIGLAVVGTGSSSNDIISEYGIGAVYAGAISGGITNSGAIFGEDVAIFAASGSMIGGIVNNEGGTIGEAGDDEEDISRHGIGIVQGSILSSHASIPRIISTSSSGIGLTYDAPTDTSGAAVGITNSGTIVGLSSAILVSGEDSDIAGAIINTSSGIIGEDSNGFILSEVGIEVDEDGSASGGIYNQGRIFGEDTAIQAETDATIGGISNSGAIGVLIDSEPESVWEWASGYGIKVTDGSVISSLATGSTTGMVPTSIEAGTSILNSGLIIGEDAAIKVAGLGSNISGAIVNEASGYILSSTFSSSHGTAIDVTTGGAITGGIDNRGVIFGEDVSIRATANGVIGGIENSGTIGALDEGTVSEVGIRIGAGSIVSTTASPATTITVASPTSDVTATGITNSGVIVGDNFGIDLSSGGTVGAATGVGISNQNGGVIFGDTAAIRVRGTLSGGLSNAGLIEGEEFAIEITGSGAEISGDIVNLAGGTITGETIAIGILDGASVTTNIVNHAFASIVATTDSSSDVAGIAIGEGSTLTGNIQNSGLIESEDTGTGIAISSGGTLAGSLQNNAGVINGEDYVGRIIGDDYGVRVTSGGEITGGITNAGSIIGQDDAGLLISNASVGSITNSGEIWGDEHGIIMGGGAELTGDLENSGTVAATDGTGILIHQSATVANIDNSGLILGEDEGNGLTITSGGSVTGSLTNSGTIVGSYLGMGLVLDSGGTITGSVTNTGFIGGEDAGIYMAGGGAMASLLNGEEGEIRGEDYGIRIDTGGSFTNGTNSINNAGLIVASYGTGIYAETDATIGTITNSGTISGGDEESQAIQFDDGVSTLVLQTGSNLIGNVDGGSGGEDTLVLEGSGTEDSTFTDFEGLIVNADSDGIWSLTDDTTEIAGDVMVNSGTLLITGDLVAESATAAEGGDIDVEGLLDLGSGTLTVNGIVDGSGTISGAVTVNGILSPGNSPGVLSIGGPLVQSTGSTYIVEHDANHVGITQTDRTDVTAGSATIQSGVTVQLDVAPGSDGFADDILTATGGVTGTYDALVYDEDNLVAMIIYPDANTVSIVAGKTDAIVATTGTVSDAGFVFLENLQEGARRDGNLWATGYLYNAENEGLGTNGADFDQDAWGFNVGVDVISEPDLKVGVAVGYMDGDIDIDSATSEAENDGIFGAAYLNYMSDEFYLDGTLMVGQQSIDTTRKLTTGEASGATDATSYGANLEAGLQLAALGGRLSPFVKMGIHSASIDSYSESGAAGAMRVGEVETQQTRLGAGLRYAIDLGSPDSIQVTPALKVGVTQQWNGGDSSTDVGFVGYTGSTTASLDFEDQATVDLGVSFDVKLSQAVTAFVGWDAALGDEASRNTGTIGLSVSW
ncbi:MAG: autotransporter domain-containing protein [Parvibaculaceae bacterium]|nr:autotransporter domain-containing protein [Parvibaculaceae bacterium]